MRSRGLVILWAVFISLLVSCPIYSNGSREKSVDVTVIGPEENYYTGDLTDTFLSGEKKVYQLVVENLLDERNNVTVTIPDPVNSDWSFELDSHKMERNDSISLNKSLQARESKTSYLNIIAPDDDMSGYYFDLTINVHSHTISDNVQKVVEITYKPKTLVATPNSIETKLSVGSKGQLNLSVSNLGETSDNINYDIEGDISIGGASMAESWAIDMQDFPVAIGANSTKVMEISIFAPKDENYAESHQTTVFNLILSLKSDEDIKEVINVKAEVMFNINASFSVDSYTKDINDQNTATFTITVANEGGGTEIATLIVNSMPRDWKVNFYQGPDKVGFVTIGPGSTIFQVVAIAPPDAMGGENQISVKVNSNSLDKTINLTAKVPQVFDFTVNTTGMEDDYIIDAGSNATLPVVISNTGNGIDRIRLELNRVPSGIDMGVTLHDPDVTYVEIGENYVIANVPPGAHVIGVNATASLDTDAGSYNITAYAKSVKEGGEKISDSKVVYFMYRKSNIRIVGKVLVSSEELNEGDTFQMKATIQNNYTVFTENIYVYLYVDDFQTPVDTYKIEGLDPDKSVQAELKWNAKGKGEHYVKIGVEGEDIPSGTVETKTYTIEVKASKEGGAIPYPNIPAILFALLISLGIARYLRRRV